MSTRTLLAGVAALLLATGTAHAINWEMWTCPGGQEVSYTVNKSIKDKAGNPGWDLAISGIRGDKQPRVRFTNRGVYLNGKRCVPCFYNDCSDEGLKKERERQERAHQCGDPKEGYKECE